MTEATLIWKGSDYLLLKGIFKRSFFWIDTVSVSEAKEEFINAFTIENENANLQQYTPIFFYEGDKEVGVDPQQKISEVITNGSTIYVSDIKRDVNKHEDDLFPETDVVADLINLQNAYKTLLKRENPKEENNGFLNDSLQNEQLIVEKDLIIADLQNQISQLKAQLEEIQKPSTEITAESTPAPDIKSEPDVTPVHLDEGPFVAPDSNEVKKEETQEQQNPDPITAPNIDIQQSEKQEPTALRNSSNLEPVEGHPLKEDPAKEVTESKEVTEEKPIDQVVQQKSDMNPVIREIIETEKDYINDLSILLEVFYNPLIENKIVTQKELVAIFGNISDILKINKMLLEEFETMRNPLSQVGPIFLQYSDFLKIYTIYCTNQAAQTRELEALQKKSKPFSAFLKEAKKNPKCRQLPIDSFLFLPIQRLCKYPLLIREVVKSLPEEDGRRKILSQAHDKISDVVSTINERKKIAENQQKILEIADSIEGIPSNLPLITPTRRYVRDGQVGKISAGKFQERHFFLFNDLLVYCRISMVRKNSFTYRGKIEQGGVILNDLPDENGHCRFGLTRKDLARTSYIIVCPNREEKANWLIAINDYLVSRTVSRLNLASEYQAYKQAQARISGDNLPTMINTSSNSQPKQAPELPPKPEISASAPELPPKPETVLNAPELPPKPRSASNAAQLLTEHSKQVSETPEENEAPQLPITTETATELPTSQQQESSTEVSPENNSTNLSETKSEQKSEPVNLERITKLINIITSWLEKVEETLVKPVTSETAEEMANFGRVISANGLKLKKLLNIELWAIVDDQLTKLVTSIDETFNLEDEEQNQETIKVNEDQIQIIKKSKDSLLEALLQLVTKLDQ